MINHVHEKLTPCVLTAYVMVPELHRVKLEDLRTTHLCEAFEMFALEAHSACEQDYRL